MVTGVVGASRQVYAIALETELNFEEIFRRWSKEVILRGDEVDLFQLPVPIWTVPHDPMSFPPPFGRPPPDMEKRMSNASRFSRKKLDLALSSF